jgi:aldose 1-epimerase
MGWHPYFYVADPGKAQLDFNLKAEYQTDETGITTGFKRREEAVSLTMSEELDHAFLLKDNKVLFQNGHRCLEIFFPKADNYLQVYTPNDENYLAIEPMTGISDSFNNKIGLQILEPQRSMSRVWKIYLRQNAN